MCAEFVVKFATEKARATVGFVGGTQISRIKNMKAPSTNTSGCHGVYYDKKANKYRARLKFKGKVMNFGSYATFEDTVEVRKKAEEIYYGEFLEADTTYCLYLKGFVHDNHKANAIITALIASLDTAFDTALWCGLVDFVTVHGKDDVRFTFKNGQEIRA